MASETYLSLTPFLFAMANTVFSVSLATAGIFFVSLVEENEVIAMPVQRSIQGGCQCGRIRFITSQAPLDVNYCHCSMCRRATGGLFATLAWFPLEHLAWSSEQPAWFRSSKMAGRAFCPHCGTPLAMLYDGSNQIGLLLGSFDDPLPFAPTHHYGIEGRLAWVDIQGHLPARITEDDPAPH
ncbi:GFA family protein [Dongia soli]|uniref:GFA family protein n=1 Tax=Dongia soli TaxID=600628 RepID=A0ABU5EE20_9PROT|nr:GFA family protein [Dongia soli]MDY0884412.1 GFA family protein [Dongia soli]